MKLSPDFGAELARATSLPDCAKAAHEIPSAATAATPVVSARNLVDIWRTSLGM